MKTNNLTISNTFNDFALQTESIDYNVEDLVSYCLENTLVFYWLNIESVWGLVGFQWDEYEDRGHFEVNPVKFNVLPKIPDPDRLKSFKGIFSNLKDYSPMIIVHNTWENINTLGNWNHPNVIINVDEENKFTKISSTSSSSNSITNEGNFSDKITLKGGDYSKIQDIGQRVLVYDGDDFNIPLLTLFGNYPDNSENKYQFVKTSINEEEIELNADKFIQTNKDNWQLTSTNEYVPSIYLVDANNITLNVDLRPFVKDNIKFWHTLFSNFKDVSNIHIKNSLSSHNNSVDNTEDMYILFANGIGNWNSTNFTYEGDEFNLPIYKSGITITQEEFESIPTKYNLFTNTNHKCRYWDFTIPNYLNVNSINCNNIVLKQGIWLKGTTITDITKPIKFDADVSLLKDLTNDNCSLTLDKEISTTIDITASDAEDIIQQIKNSNSICKVNALNGKSYNIILTDINYTQSDDNKAELFEIDNRIKFNKEDLYYIPLNNSCNNIKNLNSTNRNTILSQDITIPGNYKLILLKNSPYKIKLDENTPLKLQKLILSDKVINPFIEIPKLRYPINDPNNYEYNHKIAENYKINFQSETLIDGIANDVRLENRQPYFLNYGSHTYSYYIINTYLYSKYGNTFTAIPTYKQRLCTMRLSDLIAVDYPSGITFNHQAWFIDETNMNNLENLRTLKKEKIDEFYSKIMLNPAYKGQKDKSVITLSSEQYALFDKEQIDTLVEYGYAIEEVHN